MTTAQIKIFELFQLRPLDDRRALLAQLAETVEDEPVLEDLSAEEIAAIDEGLAQMKRGETISSDELFNGLAREFGFSRT